MNKLNLKGVSAAVWTRAIMTVIVGANIILGYLGIRLIPLNEGDVAKLVDAGVIIATAAVWAWGWWKNNSLTDGAQIGDAIKDVIKDGGEMDEWHININPNEEDTNE